MTSVKGQYLFKVLLGSLSIFIIYCLNGILQEYLIVQKYVNFKTNQSQVCPDKAIIVLVPTLVTWMIGCLYNKMFLKHRTKIPQRNSFRCGLIIFISSITFTWASAMTSFPIVMAFKSCSVLSIISVAIFCTRVKDKRLKLGRNKMIVGIIISMGVFLFSFFDPEAINRSQYSEIMGILLLFISLIADGFLPDFQAQIKSQFNPEPTQMMEQINKWVAIVSIVQMIGSLTIIQGLVFAYYHPLFVLHLAGMSVLTTLGQFQIYRMIKNFKQHIVPFIVTSRKLLTVVINVLYYHHKTSIFQYVGVAIVLSAVIYQFIVESRNQQLQKQEAKKPVEFKEQQIQSQSQIQKENSSSKVQQIKLQQQV